MKKTLIAIIFLVVSFSWISCSGLNRYKYEKAMQEENIGICPNCNNEITLSEHLRMEDRLTCYKCLRKVKVGVLRNYYMDQQTDKYEVSEKY